MLPDTSPPRDTPVPARRSLRAKALAATIALVVYLLASVVYISGERSEIYETNVALERHGRHERMLSLLEASIAGSMADARDHSQVGHPEGPLPAEMRLYMETCRRLFTTLEEFDPSYALLRRAIARGYEVLEAQPVLANWVDMRDSLTRVHDELEIRRARLAEQREQLGQAFQRRYDAVTVESLLLAAVGVAVFGTLAGWFLGSLTSDIRRLEQHARQIVRGTRGVVLDVRRDDELGRLMHAVNRMAVDLDEREKQIEVEMQRRSHQDKMMTVGALAAGVAHEVNNPLAVIAGVAQEWRAGDAAPSAAELAEAAQLILSQTQRAAQATRHLAEAATPQMAELDWVDVNAMVRRVVQLMGYDRRYRRFRFDTRLDAGLPAVHTSGDALQQVLMQMLSLGCDAIVAKALPEAQVAIETGLDDRMIQVQLLFPPVLDFTRGEVQRTLLLSRAIIEPLRGRLAFAQVDGPGLRIRLSVPAELAAAQG